MPEPIPQISSLSVSPSFSLPETETIPDLQAGESVDARVLQVDDQGILLNFNGQNILAQSSLPFNPGDSLSLEFLGTDGGIFSFRLLEPTPNLSVSPLTLEDLTALLTDLRIPVNHATLPLSQSMLEFGIPVTSRNFFQLLQSTQGNADDYSLQAFRLLQEMESAPTLENMQILAGFLREKPEIGALLLQLQQAALANSGATGRLGEVIQYLPAVVAEYILDLRNSAKEKKSNQINRLAALARSGDKGSSNSLSELLQSLSEELPGKGSAFLPFSQILGRWSEFLQAQWLLNPESRLGNYIYLQIPADFLGKLASAQVRIQTETLREGHRTPMLPERGTVEFTVTTPNLGTIQCKLQCFQGSLSLHLFAEEEKESFVEAHLHWLQEALEKLNHRIVNLKISGQPYNFWPIQKTPFQNLEKINAKV